MKYLIKYTSKNTYFLKGGAYFDDLVAELLKFCKVVKDSDEYIEGTIQMYIGPIDNIEDKNKTKYDLVNFADRDGFRPINYIISNDNLNYENKIKLIEKLKENGADINAKDLIYDETPFFFASAKSFFQITDLTEYFHNLGADLGKIGKERVYQGESYEDNDLVSKWYNKWYNTEIKQKIFDNEGSLDFFLTEVPLPLEHIKEAFENAKELGRIDKMVAIINSNPNLLYDSTAEPIKVNLSIDDFEKILETKMHEFELV